MEPRGFSGAVNQAAESCREQARKRWGSWSILVKPEYGVWGGEPGSRAWIETLELEIQCLPSETKCCSAI